MRVRNARHPSEDLEALLTASARARAHAAETIARSKRLEPAVARVQEVARSRRMASRPRSWFARVEGAVDGHLVTAVVRRDGTLSCDRLLLHRAQLVVALGDAFDEGRLEARLQGGDPLAVTLTLMRACDSVSAVQMVLPGPGAAPGAAPDPAPPVRDR